MVFQVCNLCRYSKGPGKQRCGACLSAADRAERESAVRKQTDTLQEARAEVGGCTS